MTMNLSGKVKLSRKTSSGSMKIRQNLNEKKKHYSNKKSCIAADVSTVA